jgi:hypothetical protein
MEPSGRNQWQPVANARSLKRQKQAETVAVGCDQLPFAAHGKEGVDGSSPSEGLKVLQTGTCCCLFRHDAGGAVWRGSARWRFAGTSRLRSANRRPRGTFEGTRAATVGSYVSCSSS